MKQRFNVVLIMALGLVIGGILPPGGIAVAEEQKATLDMPLEDLRAFAEIFGRIKRDYVEPVEDKVLLEHAIRGMLAGLDPHSS